MKTVYINESMLHNEDFKKRVLMDALPDDIVNKIISHRTSLGNNPSIPDVYDTPFLLKMAEKGFNDAKNVLKEIGSIDDVAENDLRSALSTLLVRCKEIEKPHRAKLEKICVNYVIDLFGVPDETVDIEVSLVDNVTFDKKTINLDPIDGNDEIEYNSLDDVLSLKGEIYKRRLLNVLCIGAAMRLSSNIESYANVIEEIDPNLLDLYHKILAINYYLLFEKEDIEGKISLLRPIHKTEEVDYIKTTNEFIKYVKEINVDGDFDMELLRKIILYINVYSKSKRSGEKKVFEIHYCDHGIMEEFAYERINK